MFFKSLPRENSTPKISSFRRDEKPFVSDAESLLDLDETTVSQRRILCPDDSLENTRNMDLSSDENSDYSEKENSRTSDDLANENSRDSAISLALDAKSDQFKRLKLKSKSQLFKFFHNNPPLPPSISLDLEEESNDNEKEKQQQLIHYADINGLNLNIYPGLQSEMNYYGPEGESESQYDSIDYELYEEGPTLNAENYMNFSSSGLTDMYPTLNQYSDSGYNSPRSESSNFLYEYDGFDTSYPANLTETLANNYTDELLYYFESSNQNQNIHDTQYSQTRNREILRQPSKLSLTSIQTESETKTIPELDSKKDSKRDTQTPELFKKCKIKFLGIQKADPVQYVAKYGPNLVNLSDSPTNANLNTKPSVKYYKLSGQN
jgi:hypothetical protein